MKLRRRLLLPSLSLALLLCRVAAPSQAAPSGNGARPGEEPAAPPQAAAPAGVPAEAPAPPPEAGGPPQAGGLPATLSSDPLLENLEGTDADKGVLAARDLVAQVVETTSQKSEEYLAYLKQALDPERLGRGGRALAAAERLVAALAYAASCGQPTPAEGGELVLRLIGLGTEGLKKAVHEAVLSLARAESRAGSSKMPGALGMIVRETAPAPAVLQEVADILWRLDGKELIRSLIGCLEKNRSRPPASLAPYLLILRDRLGISFSTVEEWERFWADNQDGPLELVLEAARRQYQKRQGELWRKVFQRIESAGDPEAYLGAITDVFDLDPTAEVRGAAVDALGTFLSWLRDSKFPLDRNGSPTVDEARKAVLTGRGLGLLLKLVDAGQGSLASAEVRRKALVALRSYASHLARSPQEEAAVGGALLAWFAALLPEGPPVLPSPGSWRGAARADLLELVRTAGVLRIAAARPYLEGILKSEPAPAHADQELLVETIGALGRVLERSVERQAVELIIKYFHDALPLPAGPPPTPRIEERSDPAVVEKALRDIRKACVAALNLRFEDPALRDEVRRFYLEVLALQGDRSGRVPAIIGLGILAKGGDREAVSSLGELLQRRTQFDLAEATAAVDALAYLGGRDALEQLLPYIDARDKPFGEHLWRKVVSLLKGQNVDLLRWTLAQLEMRAFRQDQVELAGLALELTDEPELSPLLAPEQSGTANAEEFTAFWESNLVRERLAELAGDESRAALTLAVLKDLLIKNGRIPAIRPRAEEELAQARSRLAKKVDAKTALAREPSPPPEAVAHELLGVVVPGDDPEGRWRGLRWVLIQLQSLKPSSESTRVAEEVLTALLSDARGQPLWISIAPEVRARYLKALESLRDKLKAPPGN